MPIMIYDMWCSWSGWVATASGLIQEWETWVICQMLLFYRECYKWQSKCECVCVTLGEGQYHFCENYFRDRLEDNDIHFEILDREWNMLLRRVHAARRVFKTMICQMAGIRVLVSMLYLEDIVRDTVRVNYG